MSGSRTSSRTTSGCSESGRVEPGLAVDRLADDVVAVGLQHAGAPSARNAAWSSTIRTVGDTQSIVGTRQQSPQWGPPLPLVWSTEPRAGARGGLASTVLRGPREAGDSVLRRSLRTQITTRVVALSAAAAMLLGVALVSLIVAVTGQRDAARVAFRSQQALSLANQLEKSLLSIENGLNRYVATGEERYLRTTQPRARRLPGADATPRAGSSPTTGPAARACRALGEAIRDYDEFWATSLIDDRARGRFDEARSQVQTNGGALAAGRGPRAVRDAVRPRARGHPRRARTRAESRSARAIGLGHRRPRRSSSRSRSASPCTCAARSCARCAPSPRRPGASPPAT